MLWQLKVMTDSNRSAIWRKLSSGSTVMNSAPRSVMRALRLSLARAADDLLKLPLTVIGAKQAVRAQDELATAFSDEWLLLQFSGGNGSAAVCLDIDCVSALVQMQTLGQVLPDAPSDRGFTNTDAAMAAPLIEGFLTRAGALVDAPADVALLSGREFVARAEDARSLALSLSEDSYRIYDLTVELAGGARQGRLVVSLPEAKGAEDQNLVSSDTGGPTLSAAAGVIRADLQSVICRMEIPLSHLSNWSLGDVIPLPGSRLDQTEVTTIDRTRAGIGRLGQCGGMRAVRINEHSLATAVPLAAQPEFTESTPAGADRSITLRDSSLPPVSTAGGVADTFVNAMDQDLGEMPSGQIVDEISQLAGLTNPEDIPDRD